MTGPIGFVDPTARSHLLSEDFVFSLRSEDRTTGETWLRVTGRGKSVGRVRVHRKAIPEEPTDLRPYAPDSGFGSVEEWLDAVERLHGSRDLEGLAVYHVELLEAHPMLSDRLSIDGGIGR